MTLKTSRRSLGQRSRSPSDDGHRNHVNAIAPWTTERHDPKLTQLFFRNRAKKWLGFQGRGFRDQGHRNFSRRRHTDQRFAVDCYLVYVEVMLSRRNNRGSSRGGVLIHRGNSSALLISNRAIILRVLQHDAIKQCGYLSVILSVRLSVCLSPSVRHPDAVSLRQSG